MNRDIVKQVTGIKGSNENLIRLRLFFVSYVPLWVMIAFRLAPSSSMHWSTRLVPMMIFIALALLGYVEGRRLISGSGKTNSDTLIFERIIDQGGNAAGYLATYLLPFIGLAPVGWGDWAAYLTYFTVAAVVVMRTDLILINPTLYLFHFSVVSADAYVVEDGQRLGAKKSGSPFIVVCRNPRDLESSIWTATPIGGGYLVKSKIATRKP